MNTKCDDKYYIIKLITDFRNRLECFSLENIRLGWEGLSGTNILAYYGYP
jgi:hypothetical protein